MKTQLIIGFLTVLPILVAEALPVESDILPGVTYYEGSERLTGGLTFLLAHDSNVESNTLQSASVYQFDLTAKKLKKVSDAPKGSFIPAESGGNFCVIFRPGIWLPNGASNVFIYSGESGNGETIELDSEPKETRFVAGHVFFVLERTNGTSLFDYDTISKQMRPRELPAATKTQYQQYHRIHVPRGLTNVIHFRYAGYGDQIALATNYPSGYYCLDIFTGNIRWFSDLLDDEDDESHVWKGADGRYIFFEGPDAGFRGFKLVSSPWNYQETKDREYKGKDVRVIKSFMKPFALGSPGYMLSQISPDGNYALLRLPETCVPMTATQSGWMSTYYLVNLASGNTRVLFKEVVEHTTQGSISRVSWVK